MNTVILFVSDWDHRLTSTTRAITLKSDLIILHQKIQISKKLKMLKNEK